MSAATVATWRGIPAERIAGRTVIVGAAVWLLVLPLYSHNQYWQSVLFLAFLYAVMASGWNIISGFAGYVSLGQSAFVGLGAYTVGLLAIHTGTSPWVLVPVGAVVAAVVAVLLGCVSLRTRGHAFVIITIAFLLILQISAINWRSLTNGTNGLTLPLTTYAENWQYTPFYYGMLVVLAISIATAWWIRRTKFGTGLIAIREDESKAAAVGVNTPIYKLLGFVASGIWLGAAGGIYAYFLTFIDPRGMFNILYSVYVVLAVLLGGRATIWGPVLGGFLVEFLNEETNTYFGTSSANIVILGAVMALVVLFLPGGIVASLEQWIRHLRTRGTPGVAETAIDLRPSGAPATPRRERPDAEVLLDVRGLSKRFGGVKAVDDLSFYVREGTITALIGPNGSGKTTVFNLITGMMSADAGEITLAGQRIDGATPWRRAHLGLGRTFQITRLFREMTVLENVVAPLRRFSWSQLAAGAVAGHEAERAEELLEFVGMRRFAQTSAGALSYGQQKLVELAQVLMLEPKLVLLDEPAGGINPTLIDRLAEKIVELNERLGTTFLIVEHNMPLVATLCDPVIVLARGARIAAGHATDIQRDPAVLDAYLGEGWIADDAIADREVPA